jgi:hypothetical protein
MKMKPGHNASLSASKATHGTSLAGYIREADKWTKSDLDGVGF